MDTEQNRELLDQERRIGLLTARIFEDKLLAVIEGREPIKVTEAGIAYGISRSKIHERAQRSNPIINLQQFVLVEATKHSDAEQPHTGMELTPTSLEIKD